MTQIVPIAALNGQPEAAFHNDVRSFIDETNRWLDHMRQVKADEGLADDHPEKHQPYPPPAAASELVKECVRIGEGGAAIGDYTIEHPLGPTPEEAFTEKQRSLAQHVGLAEQAALNAVMHPLKRRLYAHRVGEAQALPEDQRTAEHHSLLADHAAQQQRYRAIAIHAATLEAEIADLTIDTVDHWKPAPFPA